MNASLVRKVFLGQIQLLAACFHRKSEPLADIRFCPFVMAARIAAWRLSASRRLDGCLPEAVAKAYPPAGLQQHSPALAVLVLLIHAVIGVALALAVLHWQSRRR
jgi:hypothetical protein